MSSPPIYSGDPEEWRAKRSVGYLARRAASLLTGQLEATFAAYGMSFVQWAILMLIRDGMARTAAEICKNLVHDSGALTRVLDQLEARGLIARCRSCQDRRIVELSLTAEGRRMADSMIPRAAEISNQAFADFTHDEAETLIRLLGKLVRGLAPESSPQSSPAALPLAG